ncbi:MAG: ComEC/Rec2 family competence protein, partial [Candidatus Zambryskibacteria bacterium]|nr:ComEC/Rec2 family competence protein [Candidatus Zambryskibacteria bacterium]
MIISLILGFVFGIGVGSFFHITPTIFLTFGFLTAIIFTYRYFVSDTNRLILTLCTIFLVGILFGLARISFSNLYTKSQLVSFEEQRISAEGVIVNEPDVRESSTKLTIRLSKIADAVAPPEKILITTNIYPEFQYGDKVKMELTLQEPQNIAKDNNNDGRIFDYRGYLRVRGIWYVSKFTKVELIESGHGSLIKTALFKVKHAFTDALNNALPQPEGSYMAGLLLGAKQSLGKNLLLEFQKTGVSHVVVLSGYNIAIVATSIMLLLNFLLKADASASAQPTFFLKMFRPKNLSFGFGVVSIILFTILSGGGASAWRAAIMVLVALIAKKSNRDYKVGRIFGFAVILMLAPNPLLLVFDPSFQLSALATIGIIFVSPIIEPYLSNLLTLRVSKSLKEIVSTTVATQLTVLPFLIYTNGLLSLVSLPVNILILATIPTTMFLGFITGIVGLVSLWLSFIPAFFSYILLWYQLTVVHLGANLSFSSISLPAFSPIILIFIYLAIFTFLY